MSGFVLQFLLLILFISQKSYGNLLYDKFLVRKSGFRSYFVQIYIFNYGKFCFQGGKMSVFVIGDPHLSLSVEKPMDIFRGWNDYTNRLKSNWEAVVSPGDTVILPGDISWGMTLEEAKKDLEFINSLPGNKIIGKGNHDYWWCTMRKMLLFKEENRLDTIDFLFNNAYDTGEFAVAGTRGWFFDDKSDNAEKVILREAGRLSASIEAAKGFGKEIVVFLHYPVVYESGVCTEILEVLKKYDIKRCYFGHIHGEKTGRYGKYEHDGITFSLVSADFLAFCPKKIML